jgi:hypothetical protein
MSTQETIENACTRYLNEDAVQASDTLLYCKGVDPMASNRLLDDDVFIEQAISESWHSRYTSAAKELGIERTVE